MRLDKYLKVSRLIKRRTVANDACDAARITVNGKPVDRTDCGFFRDHSFRKLDISGLMKPGENVIETHVLFRQSDEVYENIEKLSLIHI